jgi:hypothetical protein
VRYAAACAKDETGRIIAGCSVKCFVIRKLEEVLRSEAD